jgi:hypothetical protein
VAEASNQDGGSVIAALYVQASGAYSGLDNVDPWDEARDARQYAGPWPVVAHPPCARWSAYWFGGPGSPERKKLGDDGGCFSAALAAVRRWGGVLEHPANSHAWAHHKLNAPPMGGGWVSADWEGGWTCRVEQGHYGHVIRKPTWLYACGVPTLPKLTWGPSGDSFRTLKDFRARRPAQTRPIESADALGFERAKQQPA